MKNNKKGFTLIELLAVIVILAIIMVIAVPQVLNTINNSRASAWDSNVKMIARAIETNQALVGTGLSGRNWSLWSAGCNKTSLTDISSSLKNITEIDTSATVVKCKADNGTQGNVTKYTLNVTATDNGNFSGQPGKSIICTVSNGSCQVQ